MIYCTLSKVLLCFQAEVHGALTERRGQCSPKKLQEDSAPTTSSHPEKEALQFASHLHMQAALSIERFHALRGEGLESLLTRPVWFYVE